MQNYHYLVNNGGLKERNGPVFGPSGKKWAGVLEMPGPISGLSPPLTIPNSCVDLDELPVPLDLLPCFWNRLSNLFQIEQYLSSKVKHGALLKHPVVNEAIPKLIMHQMLGE